MALALIFAMLCSFSFAESNPFPEYFEECPSLKNPFAVVKVRPLTILKDQVNGVLQQTRWNFLALNSDDDMNSLMETYVDEVKNAGFRVIEVNGGYEVSSNLEKVATISISESKSGPLLTVAIYPGNENLTSVTPYEGEEEPAEETIVEEKYCIDGEKCLILEKDGFKIYLAGTYEKSHFWIAADVIVENSNDYNAKFLYYGSANGWSMGNQSYFVNSPICTANSKMKAQLVIHYDDVDFTEIKEMETLDLTFIARKDDANGTTIFEENTGLIHIHASGNPSAKYETLKVGSKGENVKNLQAKLIEEGHLSGKADGIFGKGTAGGVKSFQKSVGLEESGIADDETQRMLYGD